MARTTYTELMDTLEALQRATSIAPGRLGIAHANGRHCVVLDGGKRDVSPWLTLGELRDWMWAAISGAHLLREDASQWWVVLANVDDCDQPEVFGAWSDSETARAFMDQLRKAELPGLEHVEVTAMMPPDVESYRVELAT